MKLKSAIKNRWQTAHWLLIGQRRYKAETFLKKPVPTNDAALDRNQKNFYDNGVTVIEGYQPSRPVSDILTDIKSDFAEPIRLFDQSLPEGKRMDVIDAQGRNWYINAAEGLIQCLYDDP